MASEQNLNLNFTPSSVNPDGIPLHRRLTTRFVGMVLLFTLAPLLILYFFAAQTASDLLMESLASDLKEKSFLMGADIDRFFTQREIDARLLSQADVLEGTDILAIRKYLTEIIEETPFLDDIDVIELDGTIVASSGEQNELGQHILSMYPSLKPLWGQVRIASQGQVFVSDVLSLDSGPGVALLVPITDDANTTVLKTLLVELNLDTVKTIVSEFDKRVVGDKHVYLVDNNGKVILTPNPDVALLSDFPDLSVQPALLESFSHQGAVGSAVYVDAEGDRVMAGFADMAEFGVNQALDWSIIAVAPLSEVLAPVGHFRQMLLLLTLITIGVAGLLMGFASRRIVKGVANCAKVAERIALGDRTAKVLMTGNDEIGQLGRTINLINSNFESVEEQLRRSQRLEAVGQLTGGVAHDFNNMLAVILGNTEQLQREFEATPEALEHLEIVTTTVSRAASLTRRLLAFSRQQALSATSVDIATVFNGLKDMLRRTLRETITIELKTSSNLWPALIDAGELDHALLNLAINARDAMPSGGNLTIEAINVTIEEPFAKLLDDVKPGDYVEIAVSDSGSGMTAEVRAKAFEPFFTTKDVGKGSGLGLSMVYGFVFQSGGHVTIYSEVGEGTTIKLYLPRAWDTAVSEVAEDVIELPRGSEHILVVEDDSDVRRIPTAMLRSQGYDVIEAANGNEALVHLKSGKRFDLLFTDIVLPGGMNGLEIAREAVRLRPDLKVLYTTGYAKPAVADLGTLDGEAMMLSKPYRRVELLKAISAALNR